MLGVVAVFHIIFVVALIVLVLLQDSKGGALGAFGGGGSNSIFGTGGGANFLVSATKVVSICFAATCITLTFMTNKQGGSVTDEFVPEAQLIQPVKESDKANIKPPAESAPKKAEDKK